VVLIALPFGALSGRRNVFVGVASSIFIFFAFFFLSQLGLTLGTAQVLPPWLAAWLPNLVFGGAALLFVMRVR
jgi:lipopolysaccharide export system permease protein